MLGLFSKTKGFKRQNTNKGFLEWQEYADKVAHKEAINHSRLMAERRANKGKLPTSYTVE